MIKITMLLIPKSIKPIFYADLLTSSIYVRFSNSVNLYREKKYSQ